MKAAFMRYRDLHGHVYHRGKAKMTRLPFFKSRRDSVFMQVVNSVDHGDYGPSRTDPNTDEEARRCINVENLGNPDVLTSYAST